jgi:hypothetical protein
MMSDLWMIAAIIEGIIILIGIWFGVRFWWNERKRKRREQGADWSQVYATVSKEPRAFLGFYRIVAQWYSPETGRTLRFKEWHHLSDNPTKGETIPDYDNEYYMEIEQSW